MSDILDAFETQVITVVADMQTASIEHTNLRGDDMSDAVTFAEQSPNIVGTWPTGDTLPTLVALAMRLDRETKVTRPGQKRFAGLSEQFTELNEFLTTQQVIIDAAVAVGENLTVNTPGAGDGVLTPVIIGRDPTGALELGRYSEVSGVSPIKPVSSQVSRKPGR